MPAQSAFSGGRDPIELRTRVVAALADFLNIGDYFSYVFTIKFVPVFAVPVLIVVSVVI
jgi:hypothetical protein